MVRYKRRENKSGVSYQAIIRIKGYPTKCSTFKLKSDAQLWAEPIETAMKNGTYKETSLNTYNINTIAELIDHFDKEEAKTRYSHYEKYPALFNWWKSQIGEFKVTEITSAHLNACKNKLKNEKIKKGKKETTRGASTVNKYLMCMSAILTYAVDELEIIPSNPMSKVKTLKKPKGRTRFLSDEECQRLAKTCKEYSDKVFLFFLFLFKTGARFDEVRTLELKDIDKKNQRVQYLDTKNNTNRSNHIDKYIIDVLEKYLEDNKIESGYIFRSNRKGAKLATMKGAMEECIRRAGLENCRIHDIRHTSASKLAEDGATLLEIAEILGQKSISVARIYSHLTKKHTEGVLASTMDKYQF